MAPSIRGAQPTSGSAPLSEFCGGLSSYPAGVLPTLGPVPGAAALTTPGGHHLDLHVYDLGLACCAVEVMAALTRLSGVRPALVPAEADVLVVSGTITHALAPAVLAAYQGLPEPRRVLAFGVCAISGGPYWDSYAVVAGAGMLVPVDVVVPGCPPRPEALLAGLDLLRLQPGGAG